MAQHPLCSHVPTANTVWNTHPVVGIAGQNKSRYMAYQRLQVRHTLAVPHMILRHRVRMATHLQVEWCPGDTEEVS